MTDPFENFEIDGREKFKQQFSDKPVKVRFPEDKYSPFDAILEHGGRRAIAEIKVRYEPIDAYSDWMLEAKKLRRLNQIYQRHDSITDVYYVNYFVGDDSLVWNLANLTTDDFRVEKKLNPKTSAVAEQDKVDKLACYLPPEKAINNS